jgi:hypothetical protein
MATMFLVGCLLATAKCKSELHLTLALYDLFTAYSCMYMYLFCLDEHTILSLYATGRLEAGRSRLSDQIDMSTPSTADVATQ